MKTVELTPIREDNSDFDKLEALIIHLFREMFYLPVLTELQVKKSTLDNSMDDIAKAIQSGRITFYRGKFKGRFSSTLSRELRKLGAEWDRVQGCFSIPISKLPLQIRAAIQLSEANFKSKVDRIMGRISSIMPEKIGDKLQSESIFDSVLFKTEKKFQASVKNIGIAPELSNDERQRIAREYTNNLQLHINDFTQKETQELRDKIQRTVMNGGRYESVIKDIQKSYGVSVKKAKFLARQETNLMMAKFKQTRYQSAGIDEYKWRCVNNPKDKSPDVHTRGNVRYYHAINDGKLFKFSEGAIVNEKGERKNPGQDYNCRCAAIPVVRFY